METSRKLIELEVKANEKAIGLTDNIIEVVKKFDGKMPTKRLDTALKTIDKNLSFKCEYNSFMIDLWIEDRSISVPHKDYVGAVYIKNSNVSICHCCMVSSGKPQAINEDGTINAEYVIESILNSKQYRIEYNNSMIKTLNEIEEKIKEYEELKKTIRAFNDSVNYTVAQYFEIDKIRNVY